MKAVSVHFVGGGRIVKIILGGWGHQGMTPARVSVQDENATTWKDLKQHFPFILGAEELQPDHADVIVVAVHPPNVVQALKPLTGRLRSEALVLSLAPKVSIAQIADALGGFSRIARCIPNAPSLIGEGFNPVAFGDGLADDARQTVFSLLEPLGACPVVPEGQLEAYAVLTAMGPTYFWFQFQQLRELGRSFGLDEAEVDKGLETMIVGAAKLLLSSGLSAEQVLDLVPVKPMHDDEDTIRKTLMNRLDAIYRKLKG